MFETSGRNKASAHFTPPTEQLAFSVQIDGEVKEIVKMLSVGDLVITSDIPLAAEVVEKGGHALSLNIGIIAFVLLTQKRHGLLANIIRRKTVLL